MLWHDISITPTESPDGNMRKSLIVVPGCENSGEFAQCGVDLAPRRA